jgi:chaperonin GroEL (HSP60 family)
LIKIQSNYLDQIKTRIKEFEIDCLISQWAIDNELNNFFSDNGIIAISYVEGDDLEKISMITNSKICSNINQLSANNIGYSDGVEMVDINGENLVIIKNDNIKTKSSCSILVRGSNKSNCEDTIRSLHDCQFNVKNYITNNGLLLGGGNVEIRLWHYFNKMTLKNMDSENFYFLKYWSESLLVIPESLIENGGLNVYDTMENVNKEYLDYEKKGKLFDLGVYTKNSKTEISNLYEKDVFENIMVKRSILNKSTEICCLILKIDQILYF